MALISTAYSIGWYGVESDTACTSYDLKQIGTYVDSGNVDADNNKIFNFVSALGLDENIAKGFLIKYFKNGSLKVWGVNKEWLWRNSGGTTVNTMDCGQMYIIESKQANIVNIPGFYPSAEGVDMGRINTN